MAQPTVPDTFAMNLPQPILEHRLYINKTKDCDIVVTGDISQLWALDLTDKAIAVVPDVLNYVEPSDYPDRLKYPQSAGTFNGGVLMINLDYWRKNNISQKCCEFIEIHHTILRFFDQDVLNALLWDKKVTLPLTYNFQFHFLYAGIFQSLPAAIKKEITDIIQTRPVIIHFAGCWKPWSVAYYGLTFRNLWIQYKKKSPWPHIKETVPERKSINWLIKRYILWPLGLIKPGKDLYTSDDLQK